jgi:hypothetical protein
MMPNAVYGAVVVLLDLPARANNVKVYRFVST